MLTHDEIVYLLAWPAANSADITVQYLQRAVGQTILIIDLSDLQGQKAGKQVEWPQSYDRFVRDSSDIEDSFIEQLEHMCERSPQDVTMVQVCRQFTKLQG